MEVAVEFETDWALWGRDRGSARGHKGEHEHPRLMNLFL